MLGDMNHNTDAPRPSATGDDSLIDDPAHRFSLTMEDVAGIYENAGMPRNLRSLQRYAEQGKLKANKMMTATGSKYLVTPHSVELHLTELCQMEAQARLVATGRDQARHAAHPFEPSLGAERGDSLQRHTATGHDMPRPVARQPEPDLSSPNASAPQEPGATGDDTPDRTSTTRLDLSRQATPRLDTPPGRGDAPAADDRYVRQLERENDFLRNQVETKDDQIKELTERSRETHSLFAQLQYMLTPLLGGGRAPGRGEPLDLVR